MDSMQKAIKMNIDHTHKTLTLLGHFLESVVKSMVSKVAIIELE